MQRLFPIQVQIKSKHLLQDRFEVWSDFDLNAGAPTLLSNQHFLSHKSLGKFAPGESICVKFPAERNYCDVIKHFYPQNALVGNFSISAAQFQLLVILHESIIFSYLCR